VRFISMSDLYNEIKYAMDTGAGSVDPESLLTYDSFEDFQGDFTANRVMILRAISRFSPGSVYQLAKLLKRQPQHVSKDCRVLELMGFIKLSKTKNIRKSIRPVLKFDYDVVEVDDKRIGIIPISSNAEKVLSQAMVG